MNKDTIIKIIKSGYITKELKVAYRFMLLSRGCSEEDIKILDDYDFIVKEKKEASVNVGYYKPLNKRAKRNLPQNLVCQDSTSEVYNRRDHTLYSLNGNGPLTKGRLAWSIIKLYQSEFNPTYEEISQLFNHKLKLPSKTLIEESVLDTLRPDKQKRFYYHESDYLESKDGILYAVSSQWSLDKMEEIINFARSVDFNVEIINTDS